MDPQPTIPANQSADISTKANITPKFPLFPILLAILFFVSTAFLAYQNLLLSKQIEALRTIPSSPTPFVSPKPTTKTDDPTVNWQTYAGTNYTIKYPSDWHTRSLESGAVLSSYIELTQPIPNIRAKIEISSQKNPNKLSPKDWVANANKTRQDPDTTIEAPSIAMDGKDTYVRIDHSLNNEGTVIYMVYLQNNDKMYIFWAGGNKKYEQTLLQILSTFTYKNITTSSNQMILLSNVTKNCNTSSQPCGNPADFIITFPPSFQIINHSTVVQSTSEFSVIGRSGGMGGPCPMDDSDPSCTYDDDMLKPNGILRVWHNKNGVFMLNPQNITLQGYYLNSAIIQKSKPTSVFTNEEVATWKSIFNAMEIIPQDK